MVDEERGVNDTFGCLGSRADDRIAGPCRLRCNTRMPSREYRCAWGWHWRRCCRNCGRTNRHGCCDWWCGRSRYRSGVIAESGLPWPFTSLLLRNSGRQRLRLPRPMLGPLRLSAAATVRAAASAVPAWRGWISAGPAAAHMGRNHIRARAPDEPRNVSAPIGRGDGLRSRHLARGPSADPKARSLKRRA